VIYGNQNWYTQVRGVSSEYMAVRRMGIERGSSFFQEDVDRATSVCLLGQTVMDDLFGSEDAIGKTIRVRNLPCQVIGILTAKGQSPSGQDQDDLLLMPFTTVQ